MLAADSGEADADDLNGGGVVCGTESNDLKRYNAVRFRDFEVTGKKFIEGEF